MKSGKLILIFCLGLGFCAGAQVSGKVGTYPPILKTQTSGTLFKKLMPLHSPLFPMKKDLSLKYVAPKLPFFCRMEEKSRSKFGLFLKLRAGNDEDYSKLNKSYNP